jgi:DNA uptake protein ComE-like DNA-binding protein
MSSNNGDGEKTKQVIINFANAEELKTLPSVGEATTENIIYFRALQGNITRDNLLKIKFVKESNEY